ncbi:MAG: NAD(P)/FAD-dependent oxidoreductase [Candidatus Geothermarchaeales archaeon]
MGKFDAIIVGAGILGTSTAYHLKLADPELKVLLIDRLSAAGQANTAKSAAQYRNYFSSEVNFLLADTSIDFYTHVQRELGFDLGLKQVGYLFLMGEREFSEKLRYIKSMDEKGVESRVYEREDLERMLGLNPQIDASEEAKKMGLEGVDKGHFCIKAGLFKPDALTNFYEGQFKRMGGQTLYDTTVSSLILKPVEELGVPGEPHVWQDKRVVGVKTDRGDFYAEKVIVAAGAWSNTLLDPLGVDSHIKPKKRQIYVIKAEKEGLNSLLYTKGFNEEGTAPVLILPKPKVVVKPMEEENGFWTTCSDELGREYRLEDDPTPEEDYYNYSIYLALRVYFPQFDGVRPFRSWAGQYAINTIDGNPYVFEESGLMVVTGGSGSGVMKSNAVGRIAAALYMEEEYAELYGGKTFRVSDLGVRERRVEPEIFIL